HTGSWASGINLYATLLMLGYLASTGEIVLLRPRSRRDPKLMAVATIGIYQSHLLMPPEPLN
ncbi:MAG: DUF4126 domain-containing protein, partial [Gammaproteobacteria bacterium]